MEITTIEGADYAKFITGTGDDALRVTAYVLERTGKWAVNWSALGDTHPAVARAYANLINRAADFCDAKNNAI